MTKTDHKVTPLCFEAAEEQELIRRMLEERDQASFLKVYDRYSRLVYNLARKILRDDSEADEVVQDVFWQFWKSVAQVDLTKGNLSSWLVTLARNRSIDRLRSRLRRYETFKEGTLDGELDRPAGTRPEIFAEKISVQKALAQLSEPQRKAIEFAYYWGMSHHEIAAKLGEPLGTIKTRIRGALIQLRGVLGTAADGVPASE
jgi:RNA polymerase sigma-70 factor (ECF subfamily)